MLTGTPARTPILLNSGSVLTPSTASERLNSPSSSTNHQHHPFPTVTVAATSTSTSTSSATTPTGSGHSSRVYSLRFHPRDPDVLLSAGWDNVILFWSLSSGLPFRCIYGPHICGDSLDISDDGNLILAGSWRAEGALEIFNYHTGEREGQGQGQGQGQGGGGRGEEENGQGQGQGQGQGVILYNRESGTGRRDAEPEMLYAAAWRPGTESGSGSRSVSSSSSSSSSSISPRVRVIAAGGCGSNDMKVIALNINVNINSSSDKMSSKSSKSSGSGSVSGSGVDGVGVDSKVLERVRMGDGGVYSIAWAPTGKKLAVGGGGVHLIVVDL